MAKDKDDNRRAVSDHKAKKKALGYVMKNVWISPETLVLISELKDTVDIPIHLHTHDTSSIQSSTYMKAIEAGVDVVKLDV